MKKLILLIGFLIIPLHAQKPFIIVGHRGVNNGEFPENSIAAFNCALKKYNVDAIEFDVRKCKDEFIIMHSNDLSITTNGSGLTSDYTIAELKKLILKNSSEKIPTLNEALACINNKTKIIIEIKEPETASSLAKIIHNYCQTHNLPPQHIYIMSFHHEALLAYKKQHPKVNIMPCLIGIPSTYSRYAQEINATTLCTTPDSITKKYIDDAHNNNIKVFIGGASLNTKTIVNEMIELGVDGLILNDPAIINQ